MVRDGLGLVDAEAAPAGALGRLEALEEVEEGYRGAAVFGVPGLDIGENWGWSAAASRGVHGG